MEKIHFFKEDHDFMLKQKTKLRHWITQIILKNNRKLKSLNYIFTSDKHLHTINQKYLNHDTFTDIVTFDLSSDPKVIETDIYISIDSVQNNSKDLNIQFVEELHRIMIHGLLHILGYADKSDQEKKEMRKKENHYLALLN